MGVNPHISREAESQPPSMLSESSYLVDTHAPAAYPNVAPNTTAISFKISVHAPTILWELSFISIIFQPQL